LKEESAKAPPPHEEEKEKKKLMCTCNSDKQKTINKQPNKQTK